MDSTYNYIVCNYHLITTKAMPEQHTAVNLANVLSTATQHWGLNGKVTACVHDNTSNMVLANTEVLEWDAQPCFPTRLTHINHVVASASRLVSQYNGNTSVETKAITSELAWAQISAVLPNKVEFYSAK